jgi:hypothetical protein
MDCEVHDKLVERWVQIFIEKSVKEGASSAQAWFNRAVPDRCKAKVLYWTRKEGKT